MWFTHGVPVHTATLNSTSQPQSSHQLASSTILDTQPPSFSVFPPYLGLGGSTDTVSDARGFAIKFYTEGGNWDIVGNNIPVFFIQDAIKFPDIIYAGA